jgi:hypothetical protein
MATRQRTPSSRKTPPSPAISGEQLAGTTSERRTQDSQVLRSSFDTEPFESDETAKAERSQAPKVTFVGEQLIYKDRDARIAEAAYLRAAQRGFSPGYELDDWLAAEREIDALLSREGKLDTK